MKTCYVCSLPQDTDQFYPNPRYADGFHPECKTCKRKRAKTKYQKDANYRTKLLASRKNKRQSQGDGVRLWFRDYMRKKRLNPQFRILYALRTRLNAALKGRRKTARTLELLGCSIDDLRLHLQARFLPGMAWENYGNGEGKWNIDHILPCARFDLTQPEQQKQCFHYSNLQPLWFLENSSKGAKAPSA